MKTNLFIGIRLTLLTLVVCAGFYTLAVWGIAQLSPNGGMADKITVHGKSYYANLGYAFRGEAYFWSRPSAVGYNAAGSAGSNKGPSNKEYLAQVQERIDSLLAHHPELRKSDIPVDLVTASGSGLDPHISVRAAEVQAARIARVRGISKPNIDALIRNHVESPMLGLLGPARVNVLKLNLALDALK